MKKTNKKVKTILFIVIITALFASCNNYFHDLIPPDENRILSFFVDGQIGNAVISNNTIRVIVDNETDIGALIPKIQISHKATLFPLTIDYLKETFPSIDIYQTIVELHKAQDLSAFLEDLIRKNPGFKVPVLNKPIDFSGPVNFIVMSGQGSIRQYKVNAQIDTGLPLLFNFGFYKYDNPELINDALTYINQNTKTIFSSVLYPAEMDYLSYELIPVFDILGDRIEVDGEEIRNGIDAIRFNKTVGTQTKTVTIWRNGLAQDFTLTVVFSEDPDSVRSITDFRFNKIDNSGISANAVASIINNGAFGTINIQVFYSGAKPVLLTPRFVSPGTVSVSGVTQITGNNIQDFSSPLEYRVVSRNNKYVRMYTVFVDFVDISSASPVINNFRFSSVLNPELVQDSQAVISDASGQIMITAKYRGTSAPETLTAEFSATGIVKVLNAVQTSGFSAQNFSRQVKYTVTNPDNSLLTRDYWVIVSFVRDTSSDASITAFSFYPDENAGLNEELIGKIDNNAGKIIIYAPIGSGVSARTMYPRFTAAGIVSVNSAVQTSGTSGQNFNTPVIYKVVSANGINSKEYTVTVRELQSTIYVDCNAHGEGDGTSWQDAFRDLKDACEAASQFPEDVPKEIWIAKGTYKPSKTMNIEEFFYLIPNTSYLGGFAGNEISKNQRNATSNVVTISGDLGGGVYSYNLFGRTSSQIINGDVTFEDLWLTSARGVYGSAIYILQSSRTNLNILRCEFNNLHSSGFGGTIYVGGGNDINISNSSFINCSTSNEAIIYLGTSGSKVLSNVKINSVASGGAIYASGGGSLTIIDSEIKNVTGNYCIYSSCGMEANNLELNNITGWGIRVIYGELSLSNVSANNISKSGISVYFDSSVNKAIIKNSIFNDCGGVAVVSSSSAEFINTKIISSEYRALYAYASGKILIEDVTTDGEIRLNSNDVIEIDRTNVSNGGVFVGGAREAQINRTTIQNVITGFAISADCISLSITNSNINNVYEQVLFIYDDTIQFTISDTKFENCINGILSTMYSNNDNRRSFTITKTDFINCTFGNLEGIFTISSFNGTFNECRFIHNDSLYNNGYNNETFVRYFIFQHSTIIFNGCTFSNIRNTVSSGNMYLFGNYHGTGILRSTDLNLKDCNFIFGSGVKTGLMYFYNSNTYNIIINILMDGNTISNNGSTIPLIELNNYNGAKDTFRFKLNNVYNGTLLDTSAKLIGLGSGVINLQNGTLPTIVP